MKNGRTLQITLVVLVAAAVAAAAWGSSGGRGAAAAQELYQHAQKMQAALEVKPGGTRTEADYENVIEEYRRAARNAPTPLLAAPSLVAIGRLYEEMGHLFDTAYFRKAVSTYQYFLRLYPRARLAPVALYSIAELQRIELSDPAAAAHTMQSLIDRYPSSDQADRARLELPAIREEAEKAPRRPPRNRTVAETTESASSGLPPLGISPVEGGKRSKHFTLVRTVSTEQIAGVTRIVVHLNGPVRFASARIAHPERVFFDLSRAYLVHPHGVRLSVQTRFLNSVVVAQNEPHVVRVVLDVNHGAGYSASLLRHPYRLEIDVGKRNRGRRISAGSEAARAAEAERQEELQTKGNLTPARPTHTGATSLTRALGLKIDRIVIDPGHGGFDTGAIGPTGLEEKTVALEIALRLGRLIHQRLPGTKVIYTRDSDRFVPLEERTAIANKDKADLFISIHANSSPDPEARGVAVYYLNFTASPDAIALAARENALAQVPVHKLQKLLKEISLNNKIEESQDFAYDVDHSLVHELRLSHYQTVNRGVRKAPFVVLIGAHMPSILVEVSFISNPRDERLLKEKRYRQKIAVGLFDGIKRYLSGLNSLSFKEAKSSPPTQP